MGLARSQRGKTSSPRSDNFNRRFIYLPRGAFLSQTIGGMAIIDSRIKLPAHARTVTRVEDT